MGRVYFDHNATAPLRREARAAMLDAMDVFGNPSSVHAEGRSAKAVIEGARAQVADLVGCDAQQVVFTSGATEASAILAAAGGFACSDVEHDCVHAHQVAHLPVDQHGRVQSVDAVAVLAVQAANSETGIVQDFSNLNHRPVSMCDAVQAVGKIPVSFQRYGVTYLLVSAHKFGGPKGVGALIVKDGVDIVALLRGGGQEMGRRSGTENVVGIAGFGAAAQAAKRDVDAGAWDQVQKLRNILETGLEAASKETIFVGKDVARLPNTSCVVTPGWKGETQVMQMDLGGFAVSAGSACSSGKVTSSRVLTALGFDADAARCAIRVSLGLDTREDDVLRFVDTWADRYKKHQARRAAPI